MRGLEQLELASSWSCATLPLKSTHADVSRNEPSSSERVGDASSQSTPCDLDADVLLLYSTVLLNGAAAPHVERRTAIMGGGRLHWYTKMTVTGSSSHTK
jgi:hypothetical protein